MFKYIWRTELLEISVQTFHNFTNWAIPISVHWFHIVGIPGVKLNFALYVEILCVGIKLEVWRWKNESRKN